MKHRSHTNPLFIGRIGRGLAVPSRSLGVALFALTLLLVGCGSQEGETVMTAGPNSGDNIGKAPYTGTYLLFTAASPNPTLTQKLNEGDKLGFRKGGDNQIEALYLDKTYLLPKGTAQAYWKVVKK